MSEETETGRFELVAPNLRWMPKWIRDNLSPKAAWTVLALAFAFGCYVTKTEFQRESQASKITEMAEQRKSDMDAKDKANQVTIDSLARINEHLASIDTRVAVLAQQVTDTHDQVQQQLGKWQKVEDTAENFHVAKASLPGHRAKRP